MKVLLITRYFPPIDTIAAQRMVSWSQSLSTEGYDVTVLTTSKEGQVVCPTPIDSSARILEIPYWDLFNRLGIEKKQIVAQTKTASWKQTLIEWCQNFYRNRLNHRIPNRTDPWIFPAIRRLKELKKAGESFDYIISSYGPPAPHIVGYAARKLFNCPWIADYRDLWLESHICFGLWPFTLVERYLEKRLISQAQALTTVSEGLQEILKQKFPNIPAHVVMNGFDRQLHDAAPSDYFRDQPKKFRIVYTGSLFTFFQDPTPFYKALKELEKEDPLLSSKLEVLYYGRIPNQYLEQIEQFGLSHLISYKGMVSQETARSIQKSADLLLFILDHKPKIKGVFSGKLFDYLYAPSPILAIGSPEDYCPNKLIASTNAGYNCGTDKDKIKKVIKQGLSGGIRLNKDKNQILNYSRKAQAQKLIQLIETL